VNITLTRLNLNDPVMVEKSDRELLMFLAGEVLNLKRQLRLLLREKKEEN
jgi:hypothetical protein